MVMKVLAPDVISGKAKAFIVADDPGLVDLTYSGPITGPSQVTIPGARQYRYGGHPAGQYAARLLSSGQGQDRSPASWLIRLRPEDIAGAVAYQMIATWSGAYYGVPLLWCAQPSARVDWMVSSYWAHGVVAGSMRAAYILWASATPSANPSMYTPTSIEYGDAEQYATACVLTVSNGTLTRYMRGPNGAVQTATASCSLSGTMGGTEVICAQWPFEQFLKYSRAITAQEAADWLLNGTIPSDPQIAYLTGHEIDGTQRVYDSGPMGLHLGEHDMSQYPGTGFVSPRCAHRYVETAPVQPVTIEIEPSGTGSATITAKRTRVGVPTSRPDSERFETATASVTTVEVLPEEWITVGPNQRTRIEGKRIVWPIRVRSSKDGTFTATADPAAGLIVSGPFELSGGACDITAQPTQAGTWTLTVDQDGRTDSVTLEALAPAAAPVVRQYNMAATIDAFFEYVNRRYGLRPRFTPTSVQDARAEHSTDRSYSRYAQGSPAPGPVFSAVSLSYQVTIAYSSTAMAEQDLGMIREEAERYDWDVIGFQFSGQTMFEPVKMNPRLTITMNFDIIPQGR